MVKTTQSMSCKSGRGRKLNLERPRWRQSRLWRFCLGLTQQAPDFWDRQEQAEGRQAEVGRDQKQPQRKPFWHDGWNGLHKAISSTWPPSACAERTTVNRTVTEQTVATQNSCYSEGPIQTSQRCRGRPQRSKRSREWRRDATAGQCKKSQNQESATSHRATIPTIRGWHRVIFLNFTKQLVTSYNVKAPHQRPSGESSLSSPINGKNRDEPERGINVPWPGDTCTSPAFKWWGHSASRRVRSCFQVPSLLSLLTSVTITVSSAFMTVSRSGVLSSLL